jgi:hypothetical protein
MATKKITKKKAASKKATSQEKKADADKKLSALNAAAKVLEHTGKAMTCRELVEAMAARKLWTSPGGATPWSTLSAAMAREIKVKGSDSRFVKAERGKFARV